MNIVTRHSVAQGSNHRGGFALVEALIALLLVALVCVGALRSLVTQSKAVDAMKAEASRIVAHDTSEWSFVTLPEGGKMWVRTFTASP
jgi:type II secretory pathway component PulJ